MSQVLFLSPFRNSLDSLPRNRSRGRRGIYKGRRRRTETQKRIIGPTGKAEEEEGEGRKKTSPDYFLRSKNSLRTQVQEQQEQVSEIGKKMGTFR